MNWAERELLKAIGEALACLVLDCPGGGKYYNRMLREKLDNLKAREEAEAK